LDPLANAFSQKFQAVVTKIKQLETSILDVRIASAMTREVAGGY
jgi:hypothetical protein